MATRTMNGQYQYSSAAVRLGEIDNPRVRQVSNNKRKAGSFYMQNIGRQ